jgi:hypothetical protein
VSFDACPRPLSRDVAERSREWAAANRPVLSSEPAEPELLAEANGSVAVERCSCKRVRGKAAGVVGRSVHRSSVSERPGRQQRDEQKRSRTFESDPPAKVGCKEGHGEADEHLRLIDEPVPFLPGELGLVLVLVERR